MSGSVEPSPPGQGFPGPPNAVAALRARRAFADAAQAELDAFLAGDRRLALAPRGVGAHVSVLVVLYNQAHLTLRCLGGLLGQSGVSFETIIVDNASTDRTRDLLQRIDGATILRNATNLGFLRAVNGAASAVRGKFLLLLNSDAVLLPGALERAAARLAGDPFIGAVGARIAHPSGRLQEAGPVVWRNANGIGFGAGRAPDHLQFRVPREIDYCCGAFMMTPAELFRRLGGFDEQFAPAYYEEMDYCFRVRGAGLRCVYDPAISLLHYGRASAPSRIWPYRQMLRNRGKFRDKHAAKLALRLAPNPLNYWRALRGRAPSPWVLVMAPRRGDAGERHARTAALANGLLARGFFVTVRAADDERPLLAGPFGAGDAERGGSGAADRGYAGLFDTVVAMTPDAGAPLCRALETGSPSDKAPLVMCDAIGVSPGGTDFPPLLAELARRGVRRAEIRDALAVVEASGSGTLRLSGATRI